MNALRAALALAGVLTLVGCSSEATGTAEDDDAGDATPKDAGRPRPRDAASDATDPDDTPDATTPRDAGSDAHVDGPTDAGVDAGVRDTDRDGTADSLDCAPSDPSRWQEISYAYRDGDGDGRTVPDVGTICSGETLPEGYFTEAIGLDCDDNDRTVDHLVSAFVDSDGDHAGEGDAQSLCTGNSLPSGYTLTGGDCLPGDGSRWNLLPFEYRDADGDGYTVWAPGEACSGFSLPTGYGYMRNGDDCDDSAPDLHAWSFVYPDIDGDGIGAGTGARVCTDGHVPAGQALTGTDCAPEDPTSWQPSVTMFVDRDGDGVTTPERVPICRGAQLPPPYVASANGNDCDDTDTALTQWMIFFPDNDGDGIGTLPARIFCEGPAGTTPPGYSRYGDDEDDTNPGIGPLPAEDILDLVLN